MFKIEDKVNTTSYFLVKIEWSLFRFTLSTLTFFLLSNFNTTLNLIKKSHKYVFF